MPFALRGAEAELNRPSRRWEKFHFLKGATLELVT